MGELRLIASKVVRDYRFLAATRRKDTAYGLTPGQSGKPIGSQRGERLVLATPSKWLANGFAPELRQPSQEKKHVK
jgi:hypothetical protein